MGLRFISECEPHPKKLIPPLKHNKYFVIGGSGFIGTAIRNLLIRNPQTSVTVLSRDPFPKMFPDPHYLIKVNEKTGLIDWIGYPKQANLEILNFRSSVAIQSCNILKEIKRLREIIVLKDSVIINSSGNNDVRAKNISDYTDDILMTGILIALKEKTQRFIQISSTEVYGSRPISDRGFCEDDDLDKLNIPINREQLKYLTERAKILIKIIINRGDQNSKINEYIQYFKNFNFPERWYYGISRRIMEELLLEDKKAVILRVSNVFGGIPLQPGKVFTIFFSKALNGEDIKINTGDQTRTFIHINDVIKAIEIIMKRKDVNGIFNISNPRNYITINNLAEQIVRKTESPSRIIADEDLSFKPEDQKINTEKAWKELEFRAEVPLLYPLS